MNDRMGDGIGLSKTLKREKVLSNPVLNQFVTSKTLSSFSWQKWILDEHDYA